MARLTVCLQYWPRKWADAANWLVVIWPQEQQRVLWHGLGMEIA